MVAVRCQLCGDHLAARQTMTPAEVVEMAADHRALCPTTDPARTR